MDRNRQKCTLQKVTDKLEHLKIERSKNKINFGEQKLELNRSKEQCAKFQHENEKLQKELKDLQSIGPNVDEKGRINLHNANCGAEVEKLNADAFAFLPDECVVKIFGYITQNQLGQIARVCRRFNMLTRDSSLWRRIDVKFHWSRRHQNNIVNSFLKRLPDGVTLIKFNFGDNAKGNLNFEKLCKNLQKKCPKLSLLCVEEVCTLQSISSVIKDLPSRFLPDLKILKLRDCQFGYTETKHSYDISNIQVLDISFCEMQYINQIPFSQMPHLKKLCLSNTHVEGFWLETHKSLLNQLDVLGLGGTPFHFYVFHVIRNYASNLRELFLCYNQLRDSDLIFTFPVFPNLKSICIRGSLEVTDEGIISVIESCPSLQNAYVNQEVIQLCAANPFMVSNKGKLEILKVIPNCYNHPKVDCLSE